EGVADIDVTDPGVCVRAAQERSGECFMAEVVEILTLARGKPQILLPVHRLADGTRLGQRIGRARRRRRCEVRADRRVDSRVWSVHAASSALGPVPSALARIGSASSPLWRMSSAARSTEATMFW